MSPPNAGRIASASTADCTIVFDRPGCAAYRLVNDVQNTEQDNRFQALSMSTKRLVDHEVARYHFGARSPLRFEHPRQ